MFNRLPIAICICKCNFTHLQVFLLYLLQESNLECLFCYKETLEIIIM